MINLQDVHTQFPPTATRLHTDGVMRSGGFTTNTFWMIDSSYEPPVVKKIKTKEGNPPVQKLFSSLKEEPELKEMEIQNEFRMEVGTILVKLKSNVPQGMEEHTTWINAYFLALFAETNLPLTLYQKDSLYPLLIQHNRERELIGTVMPVRLV